MITFFGLNSVIDRTLFTNRGPIVKQPEPLLTGGNLQIASQTDVIISTGSFSPVNIGQLLTISGSAGGRNDGSFYIKQVISLSRVTLEDVSFDTSDVAQTTALVVALANELKFRYNAHRIQTVLVGTVAEGVHGTNDTVNIVTAPNASDLPSAVILLNNILAKFNAHVVDVSGTPPVHNIPDIADVSLAPEATSLASAVLLVNDLRTKYEAHRQNPQVHPNPDPINRVIATLVQPVTGVFPGPLTGPFTWTLSDPRIGEVADDPTDVSVIVNGFPVSVDAVFGLLGAVVLTNKPVHGSTVLINYAFLNNPPAPILRLNSSEFNLNQVGNLGFAGLPAHRYRSRSYLMSPGIDPDFMSAVQPFQVGWKYKALERAYSAVLNDPNTLLLNVPTNRLAYPVLFQVVQEVTIRYDPTSLPQNATDPWTLEGNGVFALAPGGNQLTITDSNIQTGPQNDPPFFTHVLDLRTASIISAAFRTYVQTSVNDGCFTGVSFGISDGQKVALIGFILTDAINLSSAITMVNSEKADFNAHLTNIGSHDPNDPQDAVIIVNATDLVSLIILANSLKVQINIHMAKGGAAGVHIAPDVSDMIVSPDALDLPTALTLVNEIRANLNAHFIAPGIHFVNDTNDTIPQVMQAGILTNRGFEEFQENWNCASVDWTILSTYRVFRDSTGDISLYLSGDSTPFATALVTELPAISDLDGRFDPIQQVFFGATSRQASSISQWAFIRVNLSPIDADLIGDNKMVDYEAATVPELDPNAPWITIGQGGVERISAGFLILDSTASAPTAFIPALGQSSGAYRGFLRLEPILSVNTVCSFEFSTSVNYWTHSLDNRAASVVLDDENFTVQFCFLQFSPSPAVVTGSAQELYPMVFGDSMVLSLDGLPNLTINFTSADTSAAAVAIAINAVAGFPLAAAVSGHVQLTSPDSGVSATIRIVSGSALIKLGFSPGFYSGKDSNPEPRVSWFGENLPDLDTPVWTRSGFQTTEMLSRTMRITDSSNTDFVVFTLSNLIVTNQAFNPSVDWKMDCRFAVLSFIPGDYVPASIPYLNLQFCGALVSVDEGTSGKNVELQTAIDPTTNNQYLNLVSFNPSTGTLDVKAQYAFTWGDGQPHTYNIYTSKLANALFVLADGVLLSPIVGQPSPTYLGCNQGMVASAVTFGSGSAPVVGSDPRTSMSVVDWNSVTVFRDSKISDPTAASRRYIGIFKGGDPTVLSSYYLAQIDWTFLHTYRVLRDPQSAVSVFLDGGVVPIISVNYDVLTLPPVSTSFLSVVSSGHQSVAFGSFNPQEIDRTRWQFVRYSIGKLTLNNRLIPQNNITNRANAVASPDHLFTQKQHSHFGFTIYSGGTPTDDFLADQTVPAYTNLGEGTPPVPMTQDLESRGGFIRTVTQTESIPSVDLVNTQGFISDLEDDTSDVITSPIAETVADATDGVIALANDVQVKYNAHLTQAGVHTINDTFNGSVLPPSVDLPSAIALLNDLKSKYNAHRVQAGVHVPNDNADVVTAPDAIDIDTAVFLANDLLLNYGVHRFTAAFHVVDDSVNVVTAPNATNLASGAVLTDDIRTQFTTHSANSTFHVLPDLIDSIEPRHVSGLASGSVQSDLITVLHYTIPVAIGNTIEFLTGPNTSLTRTVATVFSDHFTVTAPFSVADISPSKFVRTVGGNPVLDSSSIIALLNDLKNLYNSHLIRMGIHVSNDIIDTQIDDNLNSHDIGTTISAFANDLKANYNTHRTGRLYHLNADTINVPVALPVDDPFSMAVALANDLLINFNAHLIRPRTHVTNDQADAVLLPPAVTLTDLIALANALKTNFNTHRTAFDVHTNNDTINIVVSPNAVDLPSVVILVNELGIRYEAHRVQSGVHGSTVFVRLDPPSEVLYEGMKFFQTPTGTPGLVSPFSDDETWHLDGFKLQQDQTLSYTGAALPQNAQLLGDNFPPFIIFGGETLILQVDGGAQITVTFQPGDTTIGNVISRINGTPGLPGSLASANLDNRLRLISPTVGPPSQVSVIGGTAVDILGLDVPQYTPWFISSDNQTNVSISLLSVGPMDYMQYGTTGPTRTAYLNRSALADVTASRFQLTVSICISSVYSMAPNTDTNIYVGVSGISGPLGFTAALGFDVTGDFNCVKIQDLKAGKTLFRRPFNWGDGYFHTYQLIRDSSKNTLQLLILN